MVGRGPPVGDKLATTFSGVCPWDFSYLALSFTGSTPVGSATPAGVTPATLATSLDPKAPLPSPSRCLSRNFWAKSRLILMSSEASTVDRAAIERSWRERGFSCGLWVDPPGQVWADYVHEVDELVMVVDGEVEFEIEGKVHRLNAGQELFIPARSQHTVRNLGRGESRWLFGYRR